jgi:phage terminase large subunit-like protein
VHGVDRFRNWKPDAQERALARLKEAENANWLPFYCTRHSCDGMPHDEWSWNHARADQRPPKWLDDWYVWLMMGGRGSGKTRTGSETTNRVTEIYPRIMLIAGTTYDLRETMVEGISGLLATAAPGKRPLWEPSKKKLTWPNGCIAQGFSAEEPNRLRGPESGFIWMDEPSHYPLIDDVWTNALFGHRVKGKKGAEPKIMATSTPKPNEWTKERVKEETTVVRRVSSYANIANLADSYQKNVLAKYQGTRLGQQELEGIILEDVEGALWTHGIINHVQDHPSLTRIVVSIDPAGSANKRSDLTGIIVLGILGDVIYVLADLSGKYSPDGWGSAAWQAVREYAADAVVFEKNYGGDMVRNTLKHTKPTDVEARMIAVDSRRGKELRAEPVVALYERHKVLHVGARGDLSALEDEQTSWVPGHGASPNRVDALVHGVTDIARAVMPSQIASPGQTLRSRRREVPTSVRRRVGAPNITRPTIWTPTRRYG